jgi:hypothetical protein
LIHRDSKQVTRDIRLVYLILEISQCALGKPEWSLTSEIALGVATCNQPTG